MKAVTVGAFGEDEAEKYLKKRFWTVVARNYKAKGGEIDIVAYRRGVLAVIEVKTRSQDKFGTPAQAVDEVKRARIKKAFADLKYNYLRGGKIPVYSALFREQRRRAVYKIRYDIIEVYVSGGFNGEKLKVNKINRIKNAF